MKAQRALPRNRSAPAKWLEQIGKFRRLLGERRRFQRQTLVWAATVEVRGQRFKGTLIDFSTGGARISFDGPITKGEDIKLLLGEIGELGARTIWQKEGETGLQFLLAPEEVADQVKALLPGLQKTERIPASPSARTRVPPPPASRSRGLMAIAAAVSTLVVGSLIFAGELRSKDSPDFVMSIELGAVHQHDCEFLVEKVATATTGIDFNRYLLESYQRHCLTRKIDGAPTLGRGENDMNGHIARITRVPTPAP